MNIWYRIMQFMQGRYGMDSLSYFFVISSVVTSVANIFVHSYILQLTVSAFLVLATIRALSRNIEARRRENNYFLNILFFFKNKHDIYIKRKNDRTHIYKKCPRCKAVLRLPRRIGIHTTVCPRCSKEFKVRVRK